MKYTVTLPTDTDVVLTVREWRREIGDFVAVGEVLAVCGDREISAPTFGVLTRKYVLPGETIEAGEPLALLSGIPEPLKLEAAQLPDSVNRTLPYIPGGPEEVYYPSTVEQALGLALTQATRTPTVLTTLLADMSEVLRLSERTGIPPLVFVLTVTASALAKYPEVNARMVRPEEIRRKRYVHIGVRWRVRDRFFVPVLRDADRKSLRGLATEWEALRQAAEAGNLPPVTQKEATFTLSEARGVTSQAPLLYPPQAAHLRFSTPQPTPFVLPDSTLTVRPVSHLTLTHDARTIPDESACAFLAEIRLGLEEAHFLFT